MYNTISSLISSNNPGRVGIPKCSKGALLKWIVGYVSKMKIVVWINVPFIWQCYENLLLKTFAMHATSSLK